MIKRNKVFGRILTLFLALSVIFLLLPLIQIVLQGIRFLIPCVQDKEMVFAIRLSLTTSFISTGLCFMLSLPSAMALYRMRRAPKTAFENLVYLPMSLPHLIAGIALLLLYGRNGVGQFLYDRFKIDFVFTPAGVVLAQVFISLPFSIKTIMQSLDEVDPRQIFIARTLGCSEFQSFWHIVLPQIRGGLTSNLVMTWSRAIGEFGAVMMLAGTTRLKTEVIPTAIFLNMATGDMDLALGLATLLILISIIALAIYHLLGKNQSDRSIAGS